MALERLTAFEAVNLYFQEAARIIDLDEDTTASLGRAIGERLQGPMFEPALQFDATAGGGAIRNGHSAVRHSESDHKSSPEAEQYIERIRQVQPTEAEALLANLRWRQHRPLESAVALQTAFTRYRTDPWPHTDLMRRTIELAVNVARGDQQGNVARVLFDSLSAPFCLHLNQDLRLRALVMISSHLDSVTGSMLLPDAVAKFEPHVPWEEPFLFVRFNAYDRAGHRLRERAMDDLNEFRENQPFAFDDQIAPR